MHVEWLQKALDELTVIWTNASSSERPMINAAADRIDRDLAKDPLAVGESRDEGNRTHFVFPLGVIYRIESATNVAVGHVWRFRKGQVPGKK